MHKLACVEFQLGQPRLSYPRIIGPQRGRKQSSQEVQKGPPQMASLVVSHIYSLNPISHSPTLLKIKIKNKKLFIVTNLPHNFENQVNFKSDNPFKILMESKQKTKI